MTMKEDLKLIKDVVADGVFSAEIDELLTRSLVNCGYAGSEVRENQRGYEIMIYGTTTDMIVGEQGKKIKELKTIIHKRFGIKPSTLDISVSKIERRGLCTMAQCEGLKNKLLEGQAVRRACNGTMRYIMKSGALGCEIVVSGKIRGARARSMKFVDGIIIHSGKPAEDFVKKAVKHVLLRQGVLGIKIKIVLKHDPEGKEGTTAIRPDHVTIHPPKKELETYTGEPTSVYHSEVKATPL
eukprot:GHVP01059519.1.p1 GENE.GHVP01059519.1~~GHVP01059519.1.p1  ORF type:complete len:240 (+),score=41.04 GHVP01059519.1:3-722(+)